MSRTRGLVALVVTLLAGCAAPDRSGIALRGTIVTSSEVIADGVVVIEGDRIGAVHDRPAAIPGAVTIDTGGVIAPGFIDLHNHVLWNVLPRWLPRGVYASRDAWRGSKEYLDRFAGPHRALRRTHACDMNRFGEARAVAGGVTSMLGALDARCAAGLVRNLDGDPGLGTGRAGEWRVASLLDVEALSPNDARQMARRLRDGSLDRLFVHLAEARPGDPAARDAFDTLLRYDLLTDRTAIIHGTGLGGAEFDAVQAAGAALIWSPRSNTELYGETTSVTMAFDRGIPVALAPDWALTGSVNLLDELRYASDWSRRTLGQPIEDRALVQMVTSTPAAIAGLEGRIGAVRAGLYADLVVVRGARSDPYRALVRARPADVGLVLVGGKTVYGAADLVRRLRGRWDVESVEVCGARMAVDTTPGPPSLLDFRYRLRATEARLRDALAAVGPALRLPPLAECGSARAAR